MASANDSIDKMYDHVNGVVKLMVGWWEDVMVTGSVLKTLIAREYLLASR